MNIIIQYDPYARLGNRIFQYAYGYLLSKKYNRDLYDNEGLPNLGIEPTPINQYDNPLYIRTFGSHYVDDNLLKKHKGDIIINSFLQKSSYYIDSIDTLRDVFGIHPREVINKDQLVVHVRETDYNQLGEFLGYDFYKKMIDYSGFDSVKIVTDNSKCETVNRLIDDGCELVSDGYVDSFSVHCDSRALGDFKTLLYSENIALSQSSFSWWPSFLGYHKRIIFPYSTQLGMWPITPKKDNIDLYFDLGHSEKFIL
jgi:hypothetical protein